MSKRFLVFQHMPWEKPGQHLMRCAKARRVRLEILEVWHQAIPDLHAYDGLIVLGGSPNVNQEDRYPFLRAEKEAIRWIIEQDKAYLGFCLGHQLLGDVLGARVGPNFCCSIGFIQGQITKNGRSHPLFQEMPQSIPLFKWHAQAVLPPLPKDVEILVTSADCQIEAISVKNRPHLVGLQFDNYAASVADVREWVEGDCEWLARANINPLQVIREAREMEYLIGVHFELFFENFLNLLL
ncbi:MAG: type 1 glutamine amidotransferase [Syntrophales bacterium]